MPKNLPIKLYRSAVAGNVPTTVTLDYGEIALNYTDGRLYFRDSSDNIRTLASTSLFLLTSEYRFDSATAAADPGTGDLRLNNSTRASTTALYFDSITDLGTDASLVIQSFVAGDLIVLQDKASSSDRVRYRVTGAPTDNTGWWSVPVEWLSEHGALWANNTILAVMIQHGGAAVPDHNDLSGLQGGTAAEYFHLTDDEYTGTGTGVFARAAGAELSQPLLSLPIIYDAGFIASLIFRDSGGVGYDLSLLPLNDPTADKWLYLPDGGDVFDYETLARLSDIPAPTDGSIARTFAFMGA